MKILKHQLSRNIIISVTTFLSSFIISIILIPYLVNHIGVSAYGFVPLAMFLTEYVTIITQSITSSVNRFFTLNYNENKIVIAERIFNTALVGSIILSCILIFIFIYPSLNPQIIFNITPAILEDVRLLFLYVFLSFILSLPTSIFNVSLYSQNRIDILQFLNIIRTLSRFLLILLFFNISNVSLASVGYATFISSLIILISSIYYFRKFTPDIKLSYINFDSKLAKKLLSFSSWLLISQIGFILFAKIDLLLVNLYLGDQKSGEYAIISQLTSQLRTAFGVVAGVLGPFILIKYSQLNKIKFSKLIINLYSTSIFLLFIPIIIIFIYSNEILKFWLGEDFSHLSSTLKILILGVGLMVAPTPLYAYINTASHVKFAAIISISSGVLNLIIAIFLLEFTSLSYNGVALASLSCIALRDIIIIPLFSFYKLNYSTYNFITNQLKFIIYLFISFYSINFIRNISSINSLYEFILMGIISFFVLITIFIVFSYKFELKELRKLM